MQSTKEIVSHLPLSDDSAKLLGERLANDIVIDELTKRISIEVDRSVFRAWLRDCIDSPVGAVTDELKRQLGKEWDSEIQEHSIANNYHLLNSFGRRLLCIQARIHVYLSVEDALSEPKLGCS